MTLTIADRLKLLQLFEQTGDSALELLIATTDCYKTGDM